MELRRLSAEKQVIQEKMDSYAKQRIQNNDGWWLPSSKATREIIRQLNYKYARGRVVRDLAKKIPHNGVVLDLGGGTGAYSNELLLLRPDLKVYSFDICKVLQEHGEQQYNNKGLTFVNGDVEDGSSFENSMFDAIFSLEALEHFEDWKGVLKNIWSWGKRGCFYYITTPNGASLFDGVPFFIKIAVRNNYESVEGEIYDSPVNTGALKNALVDLGFKDVSIQYSQAFCEWPAKACAKIFGVSTAKFLFSILEHVPIFRRRLCFTQMLPFYK